MNLWAQMTPERRAAAVEKSQATRRENRIARYAEKAAARGAIGVLQSRIADLEAKLESLEGQKQIATITAALGCGTLLRESEIVRASAVYGRQTGVYFLIHGNKVVYVGQSVNVFARMEQHTDKQFDRYAYVQCAADALDWMESLYIHSLRPKLNRAHPATGCPAPMTLAELFEMASRNGAKGDR